MGAWIAVASADHVARGRAAGFMQVSHGKVSPLKRIRPHDGVAYYSPVAVFGETTPCRAFTAIGLVVEGEPYVVDMGCVFHAWRRDVRWFEAGAAPIQPLLPRLAVTSGRRNWGFAFRFGLLAISADDFEVIRAAMIAAAA